MLTTSVWVTDGAAQRSVLLRFVNHVEDAVDGGTGEGTDRTGTDGIDPHRCPQPRCWVLVEMGITNGMGIEIQSHPDIGFAGDPVNFTLPFHNLRMLLAC